MPRRPAMPALARMKRIPLRPRPGLSRTRRYTLLKPSFIASTSQGYKIHASEPRDDERRQLFQVLRGLNIGVVAKPGNKAF